MLAPYYHNNAPWALRGNAVDIDFTLRRAAMGYIPCPLTDLLSCSNSSGGYVTNLDGTLTNIAANTLRIGVGTGLLVEEARTNSAQQSQTLDNAYWTVQQGTVTADNAVAPDGTTTAEKFIEDSNSGVRHGISRTSTISLSSNTTYTLSGFFKKGTSGTSRQYIYIGVNDDATGNDFFWAIFDWNTGAVSTTGAGGTGSVASTSAVALANGWYRFSVTGISSTTSGNLNVNTLMATANTGGKASTVTYTGDGTGNFWAWGYQIEAGSFPTSYIPTTSGSMTRQADVVTAASTLSSTLTGSTVSAFAQFGPLPSTATNYMVAASNAVDILGTTGTNAIIVYDGGANFSTAALGSGSVTTSLIRGAAGWSGGGRSVVGNNGTVYTDAVTNQATGTIYIGSYNATGAINGYLQRIAVWSSRLSDSRLQALSAGVP